MFWLGDKKRKLTIKYRYRKNGSIISVVGKTTVEIMEPF